MRQSLMNFWRASPLRPLAPACLLQAVIFCCCAVCPLALPGLPDRHSLMNFWRASPVMPLACWLHWVMRCCCAVWWPRCT